MNAASPTAQLRTAAATDVPAVLARCGQRILEREGIAMFVALHDERPGPALVVRDAQSLVDGARLATLFDHYESGLAAVTARSVEADRPTGVADAPASAPTDAAALIDVLVVLADQHLHAGSGSPT